MNFRVVRPLIFAFSLCVPSGHGLAQNKIAVFRPSGESRKLSPEDASKLRRIAEQAGAVMVISSSVVQHSEDSVVLTGLEPSNVNLSVPSGNFAFLSFDSSLMATKTGQTVLKRIDKPSAPPPSERLDSEITNLTFGLNRVRRLLDETDIQILEAYIKLREQERDSHENDVSDQDADGVEEVEKGIGPRFREHLIACSRQAGVSVLLRSAISGIIYRDPRLSLTDQIGSSFEGDRFSLRPSDLPAQKIAFVDLNAAIKSVVEKAGPADDVQRKRATTRARSRLRRTARDLAESQGIGVLFDVSAPSSPVLYYAPSAEITQAVLRYYLETAGDK